MYKLIKESKTEYYIFNETMNLSVMKEKKLWIIRGKVNNAPFEARCNSIKEAELMINAYVSELGN